MHPFKSPTPIKALPLSAPVPYPQPLSYLSTVFKAFLALSLSLILSQAQQAKKLSLYFPIGLAGCCISRFGFGPPLHRNANPAPPLNPLPRSLALSLSLSLSHQQKTLSRADCTRVYTVGPDFLWPPFEEHLRAFLSDLRLVCVCVCVWHNNLMALPGGDLLHYAHKHCTQFNTHTHTGTRERAGAQWRLGDVVTRPPSVPPFFFWQKQKGLGRCLADGASWSGSVHSQHRRGWPLLARLTRWPFAGTISGMCVCVLEA